MDGSVDLFAHAGERFDWPRVELHVPTYLHATANRARPTVRWVGSALNRETFLTDYQDCLNIPVIGVLQNGTHDLIRLSLVA